jgi:hypothetical protein
VNRDLVLFRKNSKTNDPPRGLNCGNAQLALAIAVVQRVPVPAASAQCGDTV